MDSVQSPKTKYYLKRALMALAFMVFFAICFYLDGIFRIAGLVICAVILLTGFVILRKQLLELEKKNLYHKNQSEVLLNQITDLNDQSARMKLLISLTPGLLVENFDESNQVRIEGNIARRFGLTPGLMEKEKFLKIIHPSDFIKYIISYGKMVDGMKSAPAEIREELRLQVSEGDYIWTECCFSTLKTSEGIKRVVCTFYDIEEQKQKIKEHGNIIQSLSNQYNTLIIVDLVKNTYDVIKDERGLEQRIPEKGEYNRLNRIFFGTRVVAADRFTLIDQLTIENIVSHLSPSTPVMEVEYKRNLVKNIEERWERLTIVEVAEENTKATMALLCINDITEQKKEEIQNRQIIQDAMLAANQANNAKSDFLSRMSHDIRTPLNAIIGMSGIASKNISNALRLRDCLTKIDTASKHLLDLVNEVLDMSRIESGRVTIATEEINLDEMIHNIYSIVENLAEQRKHTLVFEASELKNPLVSGDPSRIQQVLMNLLSNAVKYTPNGGKIIFTVKEQIEEGNISSYTFIIEDNGVGMTPEFIAELYEPFSRVDDSRTSKIEGTGLGMAIVKNLINLMNGNILVESNVGYGSKFIVTLPLKRIDHSDSGKVKEDKENINDFTGKRVLMVEDNELNMEIAVDLLEMTGVTVETAENGFIAVKMIEGAAENYYDLVFMDVQMPVMNGYEATKNIRLLNRRDCKTLPIIAVTANAFIEDIQKTKEAGMNDHVAKPISFEQLLQAMNTHIRK